MSNHVAVLDSGGTTEEGAMRLWKQSASITEGILSTGHLEVTEKSGTPDMSVDVAVGDLVIEEDDYCYHGWTTAVNNVSVDAADPSNDRIDVVVAYVDPSSAAASNNSGALKFKVVAGTPAGSPSRPSDSAIQTSVGAGNPWLALAELDVGASVSSILDADITDERVLFRLAGSGGIPPFTVTGVLSVANDVTPENVMAQAGVVTQIYARVKTAPTGADLTLRIKKNGVQIATLTISAGSTSGNTTGLSESYVAGDYFTLDVTQVGSTIPGSNLTTTLG